MAEMTVSEKILKYQALKAAQEKAKKEYEAYAAKITEAQEKILHELNCTMTELSLEQLKGEGSAGTAFKTTKTYVRIQDKEEFKKFLAKRILVSVGVETSQIPDQIESVLSSGIFELITVSAAKNNCIDFRKQHGEAPPGVAYSEEKVVQIRKG